MKLHLSISQDNKLLSRFQIGDTALFQPNIEKIDFKNTSTTDPDSATRCKIMDVSFSKSKVMYTIAVADKDSESGFYEVMPIRDVDSIFIGPIVEQ